MAGDSIYQGAQASNGISANMLVKAGNGRLVRVSVTTAGAAGAVYDAATIAKAAAANLIAVIPATVGVYFFDWPFLNGLVYEPGAAQIVSICYS